MTTAGRYIALEGIEGCGKSTQAVRLAESLKAVLTRETGGTRIGERIRNVLHDPANTHLSPVAEALLIAGDRAQHRAEVLAPNLDAGRTVVSDRSVYSSLAYQGYGRGLDLESVKRINDWALDGCWPDLVILIDIEHDEALKRLANRDLDRFEREGAEFFRRIVDGFRAMAQADPARWLVVDGTRSVDELAGRILEHVRSTLGL
ncbi:MAG: thymidylate kinase [Actinomycetota bacterium]